MKIFVHDLITRCPSTYYEILRVGKLNGVQLEADEATLKPLLERCGSPPAQSPQTHIVIPPKIQPLEPAKWPEWAQMIALRKTIGDKGVGDTAERIFGAFGGALFKLAYEKLTGRKCGCAERKDAWNERYPYSTA